MIFSICAQVILYPLIYSINYFTFMFQDARIRQYFRAVQVALEFSVYSVYLLRCLRIWYAHGVDKTRRKSVPFFVFKHENLLALAVMVVGILRALPVIFDPCLYDVAKSGGNCWDFSFSFEIAVYNGGFSGNNSLEN